MSVLKLASKNKPLCNIFIYTFMIVYSTCPGGEIGRRARLKIL